MTRLMIAVASLVFGIGCSAADLAVLPVNVLLGPGHDREAISVTNRGPQPVVMQVEAVSWTQADGEDRYAPTSDLVVNPAVFSVGSGRAQTIRLGLRHAPDATRETAYRLLLRQVPTPASAAPARPDPAGAVQVLLQLRLPVYVAPVAPLRSALWRAQRMADGSVKLEMVNTGNAHLVVGQLALRDQAAAEDAPAAASLKGSTPVFPGQRHQWLVQPDRPLPENVRLDVTTDREVQRVSVELDGG